MDKPCCANCRHFHRHSHNDWGFCRWSGSHPQPKWVCQFEAVVYDEDTQSCPVWEAKEETP